MVVHCYQDLINAVYNAVFEQGVDSLAFVAPGVYVDVTAGMGPGGEPAQDIRSLVNLVATAIASMGAAFYHADQFAFPLGRIIISMDIERAAGAYSVSETAAEGVREAPWVDLFETYTTEAWDYGWCALKALANVPWDVRVRSYMSILNSFTSADPDQARDKDVVNASVHLARVWAVLVASWRNEAVRSTKERQNFLQLLPGLLERTRKYSRALSAMQPQGTPTEVRTTSVRMARAHDELQAVADMLQKAQDQAVVGGQVGFGIA
jgi:hypothetical protein